MAAISRREFIIGAAASAGLAGTLANRAAQSAEPPLGPLGLPIGSQVYPLRSMLGDFPAFVKKMAEIGVTRLELCSPLGYGEAFASLADGNQVRMILADHGMKAESSHFTLRELRNSQQKSIEWAKQVGITHMHVATLADGNGGNMPTLDQVKRAAEEYNRIAAVSAKAGMHQGLHNEGFETSMVDGKRTYDLLFELLDPKLVKFQFQMSTINDGLVATEYFQKYPGRFVSMHLQDVDLKAEPQAGQRERHPQVALGKGSIDWVKTFQAAKVSGVQNYFVEQRWDLTQQSVAYLKTLRV